MENTITLISAVMQTIIAAVGVIITVIQVKQARKEKKRVEKLRDTEKGIVDGIVKSGLDEAKTNTERTYKELEKNLQDFETHKTYYDSLTSLADEYAEEKKAVESIYKQLLRDETEFSLSYGFERYINAFREFCGVSDDQLKEIKAKAEDFKAFDDQFFGEGSIKETRDSILNGVGQLLKIKKDHPSFDRDDIVEYRKGLFRRDIPSYDEILKYNEQEQSVYVYFRYLYDDVLDPVKILFEHIEKIDPFIKELKYKYLREEQ